MGYLNELCTSGLSMQVSFLLRETCQIFTALSKYNSKKVKLQENSDSKIQLLKLIQKVSTETLFRWGSHHSQ